MKKTGLFVLLLATAAWAQTARTLILADAPQGTAPTSASFPTQRVQTPTYADLYCAGFISKQILPDANFVAGGLQTPDHDEIHPWRHDLSEGHRLQRGRGV